MNKGLSRKFHDREFDAQEAVRLAARRAGLSLTEWIQLVVQEKAEELGIEEDDLDENERLDAVIERLNRVNTRRPRPDPAPPRPRLERDIAGRNQPNAEDLLDRVLRKVEQRTLQSEKLTTGALGRVMERLETMEQRLARKPGNDNEAILEKALARIEDRMDAFDARAMAHHQTEHPANAVEPERTIRSPHEDIFATIEAKLKALNTSLERPKRRAPIAGANEEMAFSRLRERRVPVSQNVPLVAPESQNEPNDPSSASAFDQLHAEIAKLAAQMEEMRRPQPNPDIDALRRELAQMAQVVSELAPRQSVDQLEQRIETLLANIGLTNDEMLAHSVVGPVANLASELRHAVAELDPRKSLVALESEIRHLSRKVSEMESNGYDAAAFASLQIQSKEIRELLQQLLARPRSLDALEQQIGYLTERIESLSTDGGPRSNASEVVAAIDEIRALVDRKLATSNVEVLERRVESLASKIDLALSREPAVSQTLAGVSAPETHALEAMLRNLTEKMDEAGRPQADNDAFFALQQQISHISAQIDRSEAGLANLSSIERSINDLFSELENTRKAAVKAAEQAARQIVRDSTRELRESGAQSDGMPQADLISRSLNELLLLQEATEHRAQSTLSAVHGALEKIVDRLASLEDEVTDVRHRPVDESSSSRQPLDVEMPKVSLAARPQDFSASRTDFVPEAAVDEDFLIEPRSGQAPSRRPAVPAPARAAAPKPAKAARASSEDGPVTKSEYIAAARRAAQAAAQAAQEQMVDTKANPVKQANAAPNAGHSALLERVRAFAEQRKRPLLLGLAGVMVAALGMQLVRIVGNVDQEAPKPLSALSEPTAPVPAAPRQVVPQQVAPSIEKQVEIPVGKDAKPDTAAIPAVPASATIVPPSPGHTTPAIPIQMPAPNGQKFVSDPRGPSALLTAPPANGGFVKGMLAPTVSGFVMARPVQTATAKLVDMTPLGSTGPQPQAFAPVPAGSPSAISAINPPNGSADPANQPASAALKVAVQAGNPAAQYELAVKYADGRGETRDFAAAASLFEKAANQGLAPAQYRLGALYEKGLGVPRDLVKAKSLYLSAAQKGNPRAMHNLAVLTAEGSDGHPDYADAAAWFLKAAQYGVRDSQFNLAILCARGLGVTQDFSQAYLWFALAAMQGDDDAAKKRDEIATRLDAAALENAKAAVASFRSHTPDPAAVDVTPPPGNWSIVAPKADNKSKLKLKIHPKLSQL